MTHNVPMLDGRPLTGLQHKYRETVLFFPAPGQTCHAYCTYCFRRAQFVGLDDLKFQAQETDDLVAYLKAHPEVTDVLIRRRPDDHAHEGAAPVYRAVARARA